MNNIQVAIIEDEKPAARLLEGMIKKLRPQWDIIKIPGSIESSVAWFASHPHPDIVFLDIYMEKMLGIDVARELRRLHYAGEIVFLTATSDFAVDSYEVQAGGYLLKPHSYEKLCMVMDRVLSACDINTYQIQRRGVVTRIPYHEILYVESRNTRCLLHRKGGGTYTMYKKLGEIEEELYDPRFLRCHQSYLVNMAYVQNADHQFTLFTGDIVLIRQRNLKEIRNRYLDYLKQKTS